MSLEDLKAAIAADKTRLDALRPIPPADLAQLRQEADYALTYTSNALEGNQLTGLETIEVIEHGLTIGGKRLADHLEAQDHHDAVHYMRSLADRAGELTETAITELHRRIVLRSKPDLAGVYSRLPRRVTGSPVVFPNPAKIPELMAELAADLGRAEPSVALAVEAHLRLVSIHPFGDGNGRTARLLMNLILLRAGFPPVPIAPEKRQPYLAAVQQAQLTGDRRAYDLFMYGEVRAALAEYVTALTAARDLRQPPPTIPKD